MNAINRMLVRFLGVRIDRDCHGRNETFFDEIGVLRLLISERFRSRPIETIVQIGANDGQTQDPVAHLLDSSTAKAVLVEPLPGPFAKLQTHRGDRPNTVLVNAALSDRDGAADIWTIEHPDPRHVLANSLLASFDRATLMKNKRRYRHHGTVVSRRIETISVGTLHQRHIGGAVDLLQVDTEGFDARVVHMFLDAGIRPVIINYEHFLLMGHDDSSLLGRLRSLGYRCLRHGRDTAAVAPD